MKAAFGAELYDLSASTMITAKKLHAAREFHRMKRPWVAELTGLSEQYGYQRRFLKHKADYRDANSRGSRGIWFWWTLESGHVYEASYRTSWSLSSRRHRYLTVSDDGDITDLSEEEVRQWLNARSASTS